MSPHVKRFITASIIGTFFWLIFFYCPPYIFSITLFGILITILCTEWGKVFSINSLKFWAFMPLYPVLPFVLMIYMNQSDLYRPLVYYLFILVFSFDAGAYVAGSLFGKRLIAPEISPKKTVEGFVGGYFSALVIFVWALYDDNIYLSVSFIFLFSLVVCTIAFFGDLLESYLKRQANIKDSGEILPGHGGFLDRFDAVMLTVFFFYAVKDWLIVYLH
jgi:phosphatidate cytidylyltransferase